MVGGEATGWCFRNLIHQLFLFQPVWRLVLVVKHIVTILHLFGGGWLLVSAEQLKDMCQIVTIFLEGVSRTLFYCYILVITFLA